MFTVAETVTLIDIGLFAIFCCSDLAFQDKSSREEPGGIPVHHGGDSCYHYQ